MDDILIYEVNGVAAVTIPAEGYTLDDLIAKGDVPPTAIKAQSANLPVDRLFRDAWKVSGNSVVEDLEMAKVIAHEKRREARDYEFAPLDIEATIPSKANEAEAARQAIRDRYATIQSDMDAAPDIDTLRSITLSLPIFGS